MLFAVYPPCLMQLCFCLPPGSQSFPGLTSRKLRSNPSPSHDAPAMRDANDPFENAPAAPILGPSEYETPKRSEHPREHCPSPHERPPSSSLSSLWGPSTCLSRAHPTPASYWPWCFAAGGFKVLARSRRITVSTSRFRVGFSTYQQSGQSRFSIAFLFFFSFSSVSCS